MKKIFYEKVGRRYKPVHEYDSELCSALPKGTHLIMCYPGGQSTRYKIDPNYAAMIAAGRVAEEAMWSAIHKAAEMQRAKHTGVMLTPEQQQAWEKFTEVMGEHGHYVQYNSVHDIAEAGLRAMQKEADKLMKHESVKLAYEQFLLVCELTKKESE